MYTFDLHTPTFSKSQLKLYNVSQKQLYNVSYIIPSTSTIIGLGPTY